MKSKMNHVDVFTGIAGFALAAKIVWGNDYNNVCFCDNNKFCQEVIKKNFGKESLIYGDIRNLGKERLIADTYGNNKKINKGPDNEKKKDIRRQKKSNVSSRCLNIDLLTGGFPCQPFSGAGKRGGKTDDRYLWPEMLRVIKELKPRWIIGENVAGILSMAEQQSNSEMESQTDNDDDYNESGEAGGIIYEIISSLEQIGYSVQTFVIPACSLNAPHRRDRVWIVANNKEQGLERSNPERGACSRGWTTKHIGDDSNTSRRGLQRTRKKYSKISSQAQNKRSKQASWTSGQDTSWNKSWLEVATKLCGVDDGVSVELDESGSTKCQTCGGRGFGRIPCEECGKVELKFTKAGHRNERLKALGNAIVPQVAIEIMRAIKEVEK